MSITRENIYSLLIIGAISLSPVVVNSDPYKLTFSADLVDPSPSLNIFPDAKISGYILFDSEMQPDYSDEYSNTFYGSPDYSFSMFINEINQSFDIYSAGSGAYGFYLEFDGEGYDTNEFYTSLYLSIDSLLGDLYTYRPDGLPLNIDQSQVSDSWVNGYFNYYSGTDNQNYSSDLIFTSLIIAPAISEWPPLTPEGNLILTNSQHIYIDQPDDNLETTASIVGYGGIGRITQSDGIHSTTDLIIGEEDEDYTPGDGTYSLQGGELITDVIDLGHIGNGEFNQSGGLVDTRYIFIGNVGGSTTNDSYAVGIGAYNMSGGELQVEQFYVGGHGQGHFTQTGGQVIAGNSNWDQSHRNFFIGSGAVSANGQARPLNDPLASYGKYTLHDGQLTALNSMVVGKNSYSANDKSGGRGLFEQNGGDLYVAGDLVVGEVGSAINNNEPTAGGEGYVTINDGTAYIGGEMHVGEGNDSIRSTGQVTQTGGDVVVNGKIIISESSSENSANSYTMTGGTLTSYTGIEIGTDELSGGKAVLSVSGNSVVNSNVTIKSDGILKGTGGTIIGDVTLAGGTLAPGNSPGVFNIDGDLIINNGTLQLEWESADAKDLLNVSGQVILDSTSIIEVLLSFKPTEAFALENFFAPDTQFNLMGFDPSLDILLAFSDEIDLIDGEVFEFSFAGETYQYVYTTSEVPVPAAAWFMMSGLIGLGAIRRYRR
jgi:hypothetical protein